ncbi:uncharacterized protein LOC127800754 [Diospyros lotus]|uniref:uncharacterized protein LOC127800754 n=1 Tax=Diospyros lotus TaxID=55363 RepID=UPI0022557751|nr:uncharacterized protein LOC127800754 [Diospyros lotus]
MEGVSTRVYRGLKGYWRRRGYEKLNGGGRRRKTRVELARAGGGSSRRRRFWRIKITPKLRFSFSFSPKKLLIGLRDAYVNFMLRIANSPVISTGYGGGFDDSVSGFGRRPIKEYDERMIVEIYKSLLAAQGQLVPLDAANLGSQIVH